MKKHVSCAEIALRDHSYWPQSQYLHFNGGRHYLFDANVLDAYLRYHPILQPKKILIHPLIHCIISQDLHVKISYVHLPLPHSLNIPQRFSAKLYRTLALMVAKRSLSSC